jgi:type II secretory pathway component PulJ
MLFGMPIEEGVAALAGYAALLGMVARVLVKVGRILERVDNHERRLARLERATGLSSTPGAVQR